MLIEEDDEYTDMLPLSQRTDEDYDSDFDSNSECDPQSNDNDTA